MILIDENRLTYGTISQIGQDYNIQDFTWFDLESYVDKVIKVLKEEERKYYKTNNCALEIENIVNTLTEEQEEAINTLRDLIAYANGYNFKK